MDDEEPPPPMKNFQPAERNPTAADKFWSDHQAEYENYMKPTGHCRQVDRHNDTFPKMKDELDRKRSLTRAKVVNKGRKTYSAYRTAVYNPNCKKCVKERKEKEARKNRKSNLRRCRPGKSSKVTKNKDNKQNNQAKMMKKGDCHNLYRNISNLNRATHFGYKPKFIKMATSIKSGSFSDHSKSNNEHKTTSSCIILYDHTKVVNVNNSTKSVKLINSTKSVINDSNRNFNSNDSTNENVNDSTKSENVNGSTKSVNLNGTRSYIVSQSLNSGYPNTSIFSASTYNSFATTDDEPMADVSNSDVLSVEQPDKND